MRIAFVYTRFQVLLGVALAQLSHASARVLVINLHAKNCSTSLM